MDMPSADAQNFADNARLGETVSMAVQRVQRRLAAILATDVVG